MAVADLNNTKQDILSGNDNIVIVNVLDTIRGGRTLDVTGFKAEVINAGHIIIREESTGDYKPMPLDGANTAYGTLPSGHKYAGVLVSTIMTKRPFAGIMVRGTVNHNAAPYKMNTIMEAVKKALPLIDFRED